MHNATPQARSASHPPEDLNGDCEASGKKPNGPEERAQGTAESPTWVNVSMFVGSLTSIPTPAKIKPDIPPAIKPSTYTYRLEAM